MTTSPDNRPTHSKRCLANALISVIQNFRDEEISDADFRQRFNGIDRLPLRTAEGYLDDALQDCICS